MTESICFIVTTIHLTIAPHDLEYPAVLVCPAVIVIAVTTEKLRRTAPVFFTAVVGI